jgi:hypothetical protein
MVRRGSGVRVPASASTPRGDSSGLSPRPHPPFRPGPRDPRRDAFTGEEETNIAAPAYGDADHERSTERTGET